MIHTPMIKASKYIKGMLFVKVNESIAGDYRSIEIIKTGFLPYRSPNLGKNIHPMKTPRKAIIAIMDVAKGFLHISLNSVYQL